MVVTPTTIPQEMTWHLRRFSVFEHFDRSALEAVTRILRVREYRRRELIYLPSDDRENVYFLLTGRVKIARVDPNTGKELILFIIRPGELFGLLAHGSEEYTGTRATALQRSLVGYIRRADFDRLAQQTAFAAELNRLVGERLVRVTNRLEELVFRDVNARVARLLLRLLEDFPKESGGRAMIDVRLTQQDFADLIGATRESTNKAINDFKRRGLIDVQKRAFVIVDRDGLKEIGA